MIKNNKNESRKIFTIGVIITSIVIALLASFNIAKIIKEQIEHDIFAAPFTKYPLITIRIIFSIIFNLFLFIAAIGIIKLKKWARILGIVLIVMHAVCRLITIRFMINTMGNYLRYYHRALLFEIIQVLLCIGIIIYFTYPKVKEQFK